MEDAGSPPGFRFFSSGKTVGAFFSAVGATVGRILQWRVDDGTRLPDISGIDGQGDFAISPNGLRIATGKGDLKMWCRY